MSRLEPQASDRRVPGVFQDVSHLVRKFKTGAGLAQQGDPRVQSSAMDDGRFGIPRGEQHLERQPVRQRPIGKLAAVHAARHHDVGEQKVEIILNRPGFTGE